MTDFAARHGDPTVAWSPTEVGLAAPDGARARLEIPFPPLPGADLAALVAHVTADRRVGLLLVRKGGWAVGVAVGSQLVASKVGSGYVQGRTKAGGWSQQRYARRRDSQANRVYSAAADTSARLLLPAGLEALVVGGDAHAVTVVLADPRLGGLAALRTGPLLAIPDPRLRVLQDALPAALGVRIGLNELA